MELFGDFFENHDLDTIMSEVNEEIKEPDCADSCRTRSGSCFDHRAYSRSIPNVRNLAVAAQTAITYGGAIRAAIDNIIAHHGAVWGQDIAKLGGIYAGNCRTCCQTSRSHFT